MEHFYLKETLVNPMVDLNPDTGCFIISGRSIPENAKDFYEPMLNWLSEYTTSPKEKTVLALDLDFFNISSSKVILFVLFKLYEIKQKGFEVTVQWRYSDAFILEAGRDYSIMVNVPFEFQKTLKKEIA